MAKCCVMPGKRIPKQRSSNELYVDCTFTWDRVVWKDELQRRCQEENDDKEETTEKQKARIMQIKADSDRKRRIVK